MPRKKRIRVEPSKIGEIGYQGDVYVIVEITEITESFGHGATKKLQALRNYNNALEHIANKLFFNKSSFETKRIRRLIYEPISLISISRELELIGISLEERAMRELAQKVKVDIKAFDLAIQKE